MEQTLSFQRFDDDVDWADSWSTSPPNYYEGPERYNWETCPILGGESDIEDDEDDDYICHCDRCHTIALSQQRRAV